METISLNIGNPEDPAKKAQKKEASMKNPAFVAKVIEEACVELSGKKKYEGRGPHPEHPIERARRYINEGYLNQWIEVLHHSARSETGESKLRYATALQNLESIVPRIILGAYDEGLRAIGTNRLAVGQLVEDAKKESGPAFKRYAKKIFKRTG